MSVEIIHVYVALKLYASASSKLTQPTVSLSDLSHSRKSTTDSFELVVYYYHNTECLMLTCDYIF